jgi:phage tail-like protein
VSRCGHEAEWLRELTHLIADLRKEYTARRLNLPCLLPPEIDSAIIVRGCHSCWITRDCIGQRLIIAFSSQKLQNSPDDPEHPRSTMTKAKARLSRFDPYKNFRFRIKWDGRYVAGISKMTALKRSTEVVEFREGSDPSRPRKLPGRTDYEPITLERGLTHDDAFEQWANQVMQAGMNSAAPTSNFRKDIVVDLFDEKGKKVLSYKVFRCWVSEYQALPDLDAAAKTVLIQHIKLENEGWERHITVP